MSRLFPDSISVMSHTDPCFIQKISVGLEASCQAAASPFPTQLQCASVGDLGCKTIDLVSCQASLPVYSTQLQCASVGGLCCSQCGLMSCPSLI